MPTTKKTAKKPLDRLTALGQDVLDKASQNPTAAKLIQGAAQLRDQVDDLSKRVRGLEKMEKQLSALEKRVAKLEKPAKKPAPRKKTTETAPEPRSPDAS